MLFVIVGPSGSGKDTVLNWLRHELKGHSGIQFIRRAVTRPADALYEDHDTMTIQEFDEAERTGGFAVTWKAHELRYAVPKAVHAHLAAGRVAIVNGSRRALHDFHDSFDRLRIINLQVDPAILAARLASRNRESGKEIVDRLKHSDLPLAETQKAIHINNNGPIEQAGRAIWKEIQNCLRNE